MRVTIGAVTAGIGVVGRDGAPAVRQPMFVKHARVPHYHHLVDLLVVRAAQLDILQRRIRRTTTVGCRPCPVGRAGSRAGGGGRGRGGGRGGGGCSAAWVGAVQFRMQRALQRRDTRPVTKATDRSNRPTVPLMWREARVHVSRKKQTRTQHTAVSNGPVQPHICVHTRTRREMGRVCIFNVP